MNGRKIYLGFCKNIAKISTGVSTDETLFAVLRLKCDKKYVIRTET